jgi:hypothetical protein
MSIALPSSHHHHRLGCSANPFSNYTPSLSATLIIASRKTFFFKKAIQMRSWSFSETLSNPLGRVGLGRIHLKETKKKSHTRESSVADLFYLSFVVLCYTIFSLPFLLVPLLCISELIPSPDWIDGFSVLSLLSQSPERHSSPGCEMHKQLACTLSTAELCSRYLCNQM